MEKQPVPRSLTHVGITVPDAEEAAEWYEEVFGFQRLRGPYSRKGSDSEVASQTAGAFDEMTVVQMVTGNQVGFELFEFDSDRVDAEYREPDYQQLGPHHVCIIDPNLEDLVDTVEAHGGEQVCPVTTPFPGQKYQFVYVRDPWGNYIEIYTHSHEQFMANQE